MTASRSGGKAASARASSRTCARSRIASPAAFTAPSISEGQTSTTCTGAPGASKGQTATAPGKARRSRDSTALPEFRLSGSDNRISVVFASDWAEQHPLTLFDLQQEARSLAPIGITLNVSLTAA